MNTPTTPAKIPAAWLRPAPGEYKIPVWRWFVMPAATWMLHHYRGAWVSGELSLRADDICFQKAGLLKTAKSPAPEWTIRLADISSVAVKKGMASETISIYYSGGITKLMSARSQDFITLLNRAASKARSDFAAHRGEADNNASE